MTGVVRFDTGTGYGTEHECIGIKIVRNAELTPPLRKSELAHSLPEVVNRNCEPKSVGIRIRKVRIPNSFRNSRMRFISVFRRLVMNAENFLGIVHEMTIRCR